MAFNTKHNTQSHLNHSKGLPTGTEPIVLICVHCALFIGHSLSGGVYSTSPHSTTYIQALTSDPEQRRGFCLTGRQTLH